MSHWADVGAWRMYTDMCSAGLVLKSERGGFRVLKLWDHPWSRHNRAMFRNTYVTVMFFVPELTHWPSERFTPSPVKALSTFPPDVCWKLARNLTEEFWNRLDKTPPPHPRKCVVEVLIRSPQRHTGSALCNTPPWVLFPAEVTLKSPSVPEESECYVAQSVACWGNEALKKWQCYWMQPWSYHWHNMPSNLSFFHSLVSRDEKSWKRDWISTVMTNTISSRLWLSSLCLHHVVCNRRGKGNMFFLCLLIIVKILFHTDVGQGRDGCTDPKADKLMWEIYCAVLSLIFI